VYDEAAGTYKLAGTEFFWDTATMTGGENPAAQLFAGDDESKVAVHYDAERGVVYAISGSSITYYAPDGTVFAQQPTAATLPVVEGLYVLSAVEKVEGEYVYTYTHGQTGETAVYSAKTGKFTVKGEILDALTDPFVPDDKGTGVCQPRYDKDGNFYWFNTHDEKSFTAKIDVDGKFVKWILVGTEESYTVAYPELLPPE